LFPRGRNRAPFRLSAVSPAPSPPHALLSRPASSPFSPSSAAPLQQTAPFSHLGRFRRPTNTPVYPPNFLRGPIGPYRTCLVLPSSPRWPGVLPGRPFLRHPHASHARRSRLVTSLSRPRVTHPRPAVSRRFSARLPCSNPVALSLNSHDRSLSRSILLRRLSRALCASSSQTGGHSFARPRGRLSYSFERQSLVASASRPLSVRVGAWAAHPSPGASLLRASAAARAVLPSA